MKAFLLVSAVLFACALGLFAQTPADISPTPSIAPGTPAATPVVSVSPAPATAAATASSPNRFADEIRRKAANRHQKGFHIDIDDSGKGSEHIPGDAHDGSEIPHGVIPIVAISVLAFFGFPVAIVAVIMFSSWAKARSLHRTVRTLVEKGQPVPAELLASPAGAPLRPWYDLRRGIVLLAVGVGVIMFFGIAAGWDEGIWALGLIPGLIGLGYILAWRLAQKQANGFKV